LAEQGARVGDHACRLGLSYPWEETEDSENEKVR
jgi:hypothetical protein